MISQMLKNQKKFWGDIWSELIDYNRDAKLLKDLQCEVTVTKQEKVDITKYNAKLKITRSRLSPGVLIKEF